MRNKKILLLSLALLGVVGTSIGMNNYQNVVNKAEAASTTVVFDAGNGYANLSNNQTKMIGSYAKIIAFNSVSLSTSANKYGYRFDNGRGAIVFKFTNKVNINFYHNANSTGGRYLTLSSFTSTKQLEDISDSDYSTKTIVSFTNVSPTTFNGGVEAVISVNSDNKSFSYTKKGCAKVTYENLSAGYYVLLGIGSEAYLQGFTFEEAEQIPQDQQCSVTFDFGSEYTPTNKNYENPTVVAQNGTIVDPKCGIDEINHMYISGWYKDNSFESKFNFDSDTVPSVATYTLYAKWEVIPYAHFDAVDGLIDEVSEKDVYASVNGYELGSIDAPRPTKKGYKFVGWNNAEGKLTTEFVSGQTYTAVYEEINGETVDFNINDTKTTGSEETQFRWKSSSSVIGNYISIIDGTIKTATYGVKMNSDGYLNFEAKANWSVTILTMCNGTKSWGFKVLKGDENSNEEDTSAICSSPKDPNDLNKDAANEKGTFGLITITNGSSGEVTLKRTDSSAEFAILEMIITYEKDVDTEIFGTTNAKTNTQLGVKGINVEDVVSNGFKKVTSIDEILPVDNVLGTKGKKFTLEHSGKIVDGFVPYEQGDVSGATNYFESKSVNIINGNEIHSDSTELIDFELVATGENGKYFIEVEEHSDDADRDGYLEAFTGKQLKLDKTKNQDSEHKWTVEFTSEGIKFVDTSVKDSNTLRFRTTDGRFNAYADTEAETFLPNVYVESEDVKLTSTKYDFSNTKASMRFSVDVKKSYIDQLETGSKLGTVNISLREQSVKDDLYLDKSKLVTSLEKPEYYEIDYVLYDIDEQYFSDDITVSFTIGEETKQETSKETIYSVEKLVQTYLEGEGLIESDTDRTLLNNFYSYIEGRK